MFLFSFHTLRKNATLFWRSFYLRLCVYLHLKKVKRMTLMVAKDVQWLNSIPSLELISKINKITYSSVPSRERGEEGEKWGTNQFSLNCYIASQFTRPRICLEGDDFTLFHKPISLGIVEGRVHISYLISLMFLLEIKKFPYDEE